MPRLGWSGVRSVGRRWISSPASSVKSSGGTTPVPVAGCSRLEARLTIHVVDGKRGSRRIRENDVFRQMPSRPPSQYERRSAYPPAALRADEHRGPERARAVVDLRLGKGERVLALDVARAHVIADRVADDRAACVDAERNFGFGHAPPCVAANAHRLVGRAHAPRRALEKKLRPLGLVHAIVERAAARILRLLHARGTAAHIRDARRPHLLRPDRRQNPRVDSLCGGAPGDGALEIRRRSSRSSTRPTRRDGEKAPVVLHEHAAVFTIEAHRSADDAVDVSTGGPGTPSRCSTRRHVSSGSAG